MEVLLFKTLSTISIFCRRLSCRGEKHWLRKHNCEQCLVCLSPPLTPLPKCHKLIIMFWLSGCKTSVDTKHLIFFTGEVKCGWRWVNCKVCYYYLITIIAFYSRFLNYDPHMIIQTIQKKITFLLLRTKPENSRLPPLNVSCLVFSWSWGTWIITVWSSCPLNPNWEWGLQALIPYLMTIQQKQFL